MKKAGLFEQKIFSPNNSGDPFTGIAAVFFTGS